MAVVVVVVLTLPTYNIILLYTTTQRVISCSGGEGTPDDKALRLSRGPPYIVAYHTSLEFDNTYIQMLTEVILVQTDLNVI